MKTDESIGATAHDFVISRTFDAPRDLVWQAYSSADALAQWWGPKGMKLEVVELDFRPGGRFLYCMKAPDGVEGWGKFIYREIEPPTTLSFVVSFSDSEGGTTRHPASPNWPLELWSVLTLSEEDGKTTVTVRARPIHASEIERETFDAGHDSMRQGFGGTFDELEAFLAKEQGK